MRVIPCLCVLLGGCFLNHGLSGSDGPADAGPSDSPGFVDASDPFDAPGFVDAGVDAAPMSCRPAAATELCHQASFDAPPHFTLSTDDCHCGGSLVCHVEVLTPASGGARGELRAELEVCDEGVCRACTGPNSVECSVSAPPGDYHVTTSAGEFLLTGLGATPPTDPVVRECQSVGPSGGLCESIGEFYVPSEVCLTPGAPIVVHGGSSCAYDPGPCSVVYLNDRGGLSIGIAPRQRRCDESGPVWDCETWECPAAPADGRDAAVYVGGEEVGRFDPEGGEQCFRVGPTDG